MGVVNEVSGQLRELRIIGIMLSNGVMRAQIANRALYGKGTAQTDFPQKRRPWTAGAYLSPVRDAE